MLRLSKLTDYGVVLMRGIAAAPAPGGALTTRELAALAGLPTATASKLLKALHRAGLLESQRGLRGGYRLARPAAAISVAEVVRALEGPIALTDCQAHTDDRCRLLRVCPLRGPLHAINRSVVAALEGLTLAQLATAPGAPPPEAR